MKNLGNRAGLRPACSEKGIIIIIIIIIILLLFDRFNFRRYE